MCNAFDCHIGDTSFIVCVSGLSIQNTEARISVIFELLTGTLRIVLSVVVEHLRSANSEHLEFELCALVCVQTQSMASVGSEAPQMFTTLRWYKVRACALVPLPTLHQHLLLVMAQAGAEVEVEVHTERL